MHIRNMLRGGVALTALAAALAVSGVASAQSTGTTLVEELVVTAAGKDIDGVITAEMAPKSRATVDQEYLSTQQPGQTVLQSINLMPAVSFANNDSYGVSGGDVVIRGFDSQRISLNVDGIQLNDTGNYAIYSNQQLDPELIENVTVNLGTTDVDSPTASATGGTINYRTIRPTPDFGGFLQGSYGTEDYKRIFGIIHSGDLGWGLSGWAAASYTNYDQFVGPGELEKQQYNGMIRKDFDNGDFISVAGHLNINRNNFYRRVSVDKFNDGTLTEADKNADANCTLTTPGGGARQDDFPVCFNYYNLSINPSNTGNIRGASRFSLTDNLTLTIDPVFQYVLANGGGSTAVEETDPRLQGSQFDPAAPLARGVDINGDGDTLDRIRLYSPSNTNTRRYSLNSSLIWDVNPTNRVRLAYTYDYGRHRQTGEYGRLDSNGDPVSVFGGKRADPILSLDGDVFQKRDRFSIAELNQVAIEYVGRFMDEQLIVSAGVRAPFFSRDLNNYCFQEDTFNAYCAPHLTEAEVEVIRARNVGSPVSFERKYDDILPNLGVVWRFAGNQQVFANYSENLSAPRTDDLYDRIPADPEPETSRQFDAGYRYQSGMVIASVAAFHSSFQNYIVRASDTDPVTGETVARSINAGDVDRWGVDGQLGVRPTDNLSLYATAAYIKTEVQQDTPNAFGGFAPTKGKQLPEVPQWQFGGRAEYKVANFTVGVQGKWTDDRFTNLVNDEKAPSYTVFDADVRYDLDSVGWNGAFIQVNVQNIFDEEYMADISTDLDGNRTGNLGAPRSVSATLRAAF